MVEKKLEEPFIRLKEDLTYQDALKLVMAGKDFEVGIRRMDEKHRSPKPGTPNTQYLTKQDGELWRVTEGGGRRGRVGKGKDKQWYTLNPANPKGKAIKSEKIPDVLMAKPKKAIPKSKLRKKEKIPDVLMAKPKKAIPKSKLRKKEKEHSGDAIFDL